MKIEIWSDIMCPFCFIGKRQLEAALQQFPNGKFEIEWKSFQLDSSIIPQPGKDVYTFLSERKGISIERSVQLHEDISERAKSVGLNFNFDKTIIANSLTLHRIIQLAKTKNLGDEVEEVFFQAYFVDGRNLNDQETLLELAKKAGLLVDDVNALLHDVNLFEEEVIADIHEALLIGVQGVPFFVFDRKYAISGAQPIETFVQTIIHAQN
jgi:predicted DsbA family dithiol-disulfide isomerase